MKSLNNLFTQFGTKKSFKKGEHLFKQGDLADHIFYINTGLLKAYYLTDDGKEFVKSFLREGNIIGSLRSTTDNTASYFSTICLEDTQVISMPFEKIHSIAKDSLEVSTALIESLISLSVKKEKREYEFLCLSAQHRYELLKKEDGEILDRVSQNDIAKYLGITGVALSRIRKILS